MQLSSKIYLFTISLLIIVLLYSCGKTDKVTEAVEYNNNIVYAQNRIITKMIDFSKAINSMDSVKMQSAYSCLKTEIDSSISEIKVMPAFENDSNLRIAALELFNFYNSIVLNEYAKLIDIYINHPYELSNEDNIWIKNMTFDVKKRESEFDEKFTSEQNNFAFKNNFTIVKNKFQDIIDSSSK